MEREFFLTHKSITIPCKLTEPDRTLIKRVVLGVHGLGGSTEDAIQAAIAEEMELFYAATLRFDFPAHGDSPVTGSDLTLEQCRQSLAAVVKWAKQAYPYVDMGIFATGLGAFVTLVTLDDLRQIRENLKLVLQTPDLSMARTLLRMVRMTEEEFCEQGRAVIGAGTSRALEVPYSFYEELQGHMVYYNHEMPMLLLHGEMDDLIPFSHLEPFRRFNDQSKLVIIPGADHQFRGAGQWNMVVDLTRDWFQCEQVLLCDWE